MCYRLKKTGPFLHLITHIRIALSFPLPVSELGSLRGAQCDIFVCAKIKDMDMTGHTLQAAGRQVVFSGCGCNTFILEGEEKKNNTKKEGTGGKANQTNTNEPVQRDGRWGEGLRK